MTAHLTRRRSLDVRIAEKPLVFWPLVVAMVLMAGASVALLVLGRAAGVL